LFPRNYISRWAAIIINGSPTLPLGYCILLSTFTHVILLDNLQQTVVPDNLRPSVFELQSFNAQTIYTQTCICTHTHQYEHGVDHLLPVWRITTSGDIRWNSLNCKHRSTCHFFNFRIIQQRNDLSNDVVYVDKKTQYLLSRSTINKNWT